MHFSDLIVEKTTTSKTKSSTQKPPLEKKTMTSATDYDRLFALENDIINHYGFEGVKLVRKSETRGQLYNLGEFPADCPWAHLNDKSIQEAIAVNFRSIDSKIPLLLTTLKTRGRFIYTEKFNNNWQLHYLLSMKLYTGNDHFIVYTGGVPNPNSQANDDLKSHNWNLPDALKTFYAIHDGFGGKYDHNVLANADLRVMASHMDKICKEIDRYPEAYSFKDLLEFFPDGAGNAECFHKNKGNITVDWDHETWELSPEIDFFEFIDERLSKVDEE